MVPAPVWPTTTSPPVYPTTCLIGLNSPYLNRAHDYNCTIEQVAAQWIPEIRARQPHGPYILGDCSAGGYYSYEVTKQLLAQGEAVSKLILLDSPCRTDFAALPVEWPGIWERQAGWGTGIPVIAPQNG
ncbi:uncharacterized protein SETTUDRAFT_34553 [Exserohilum turcica Et28A]|uniref:Thioesterase domain-containing protein n=1 Tax=Exserohilum turcicum (strain 28A) TaxID=671987 RepID=R0K3W3_EXST2|nr:uncharacterized protein SETTUDRAFT_34553 [Exserohilum turcica Et28A]EOA83042.1 hypothetical protein SETTUDRAFT_34553 [Exserohilum turcica Et28A]